MSWDMARDVASGAAALKPINLPGWKNIDVDMEEVTSGHTAGGNRAIQSGKKDLFPADWSEDKIERAIREAYRNGQKMSGIQEGGRVFVVGQAEGRTIEMWVNTETKVIESAWPK
jgi:hypothetical protein